eukprot:Clim_evm31s203 gene=Clim_evmTU31s203
MEAKGFSSRGRGGDYAQDISLSNSNSGNNPIIKRLARPKQESGNNEIKIPHTIPMLPIENKVLLPNAMMRIVVQSEGSLEMVEQEIVKSRRNIIAMVPSLDDEKANDHKVGEAEDGSVRNLKNIGTAARVLQITKASRGEKRYILMVEGLVRIRVHSLTNMGIYYLADITPLLDVDIPANRNTDEDTQYQGQIKGVKNMAKEMVSMLEGDNNVTQRLQELLNTAPAEVLPDILCSVMDLPPEDKYELLKEPSVPKRMATSMRLMQKQIEVLKVSKTIAKKMEDDLTKAQREIILRQQMKAIQEELGEGNGEGGSDNEIEELKRRLEGINMPPDARKVVTKELKRISRMSTQMAEYNTLRDYLEFMAELPWDKYTEDNLDIHAASNHLDAEHYGLEKVKKRILQYLAVRKLRSDMRGPILCLVGPPGVGKTSLATSVAKSVGRPLQRISLGGVRDEADIRGHRRTYIGAMPGRVIQGMHRAGVANPLFVLDEVDKLTRDFRGDPAAALLEVLDPEQNSSFVDHYLNVHYDLSKVMFIATANDASTIPPALRDRMEMIRIEGYTYPEKVMIAMQHLIPKQLKEHGMKDETMEFTPEIVQYIVDNYTREAGVRSLEREIASVIRAHAVNVASDDEHAVDDQGNVLASSIRTHRVDVNFVQDALGPPPFKADYADRIVMPGIVNGLAWTAAGGDVMIVEAAVSAGNGKVMLTGQLGDVIKESAQLAVSVVRTRAHLLGIQQKLKERGGFDKIDLHIHLPEGAVPKDGPSAGITMVTALASTLMEVKARADTAMTGEVTLTGKVLPVGGIKEKCLAASRRGIKRIIMCHQNEKDVNEIPEASREEIEFHFVDTVDEVLPLALESPPKVDNTHSSPPLTIANKL